MAMQIDLTPTERLLMLSLQFEPKQTLERLQKTTRTNTSKHLAVPSELCVWPNCRT